MSIFPFTSYAEEPRQEELPVFKEMAYDFEKNCLLRRNGKIYLVEKDEALKVWIWKALKAKRYIWPAYSRIYGTEIDKVQGTCQDRSIQESEIRRYITETLMVCPYIQQLTDFVYEHKGAKTEVSFTVISIYGRITYESEVYNE